MRRPPYLPLLLSLLLSATGAGAQTEAPRDGTIVEQVPCETGPAMTYEQYVEMEKRRQVMEVEAARLSGFELEAPLVLMSREELARFGDHSQIDCQHIKYLSDGLKVAGFLWKPKDTAGRKLPVILFNRGGNREFGKLGPWGGIHRFAAEGFVVIASQYRGNDGGEGREEFGGADVRDVLNLIPLASSLDCVDMGNVFLYGVSRGGMMTYLALKNGIPVNAAATVGGMTDLVSEAARRPSLVINVWKEMIPDFDKRREELLRERSAVYWAEKINVPILILQGGADWRVGPGSALAFAQKLQELGKEYELIVYAGADHGISQKEADRDRRIIDWFRSHMKGSAPGGTPQEGAVPAAPPSP